MRHLMSPLDFTVEELDQLVRLLMEIERRKICVMTSKSGWRQKMLDPT